MYLPMRAHWRHLANTIELVLPFAHPSPQPKWQIDQLSHFCTVHGTVSSGIPGHVLSPNNCPFAWGIWAHLIHASSGPPESITQTPSWSVGPFLHSSHQIVVRHVGHTPPPSKLSYPWGSVPPSNMWFFGPPNSASQTVSRSFQPFLHSSRQRVPILCNGRPFPLKLPLPMGIWTPI